MTTFIIAALTADGFIGKDSTHSPLTWRSEGDRKFFIERTKQAGLAIMGLNTAKTSKRPLPGRRNIIYADNKDQLLHWQEYGEWEITQDNPKELLSRLKKDGHKEIAICGGATIYTMFMEQNLVDKLYLSIEPVLFGKGITLFNKELDTKLQLKNVSKLGEQTILLEYNVLKLR
ncbi:dihydrofolate reductase [Patescibacteria group bacterium]|nr:dihydrofolate reductase [Patescibacteria group bacterium]